MKEEYRKDDEQIKAHILVNLPEEYKAIQMNLCTNQICRYKGYLNHIRNFWLSRLGFKEIVEKGICELFLRAIWDSIQGTGEVTLSTESTKGIFKGSCCRCAQSVHEAKNYIAMKKKFKDSAIGVRARDIRKHNTRPRSMETQEYQPQHKAETMSLQLPIMSKCLNIV